VYGVDFAYQVKCFVHVFYSHTGPSQCRLMIGMFLEFL
jgi:hypothetical protein